MSSSPIQHDLEPLQEEHPEPKRMPRNALMIAATIEEEFRPAGQHDREPHPA